jgi:AcrR family transcriptional regulator
MPPPVAVQTRPSRADNRLPAVLDAAAMHFAGRGYAATSMRDIAESAGMLAGSLYYHFKGKEDLLAAVYAAGVEQLTRAATAAIERETEPWAQLEAACIAHLETLLRQSDYAQVLIRVLPEDVPPVAARLRALRSAYEEIYRKRITALPLPAGTDRRTLRLMLLGALNWSHFWYREDGRDSPRAIARRFLRLLGAHADSRDPPPITKGKR